MNRLAIVALSLLALTPSAEARGRSGGGGGGCCVLVHGYVRGNGTYVQPYLRSPPGAKAYSGYAAPSIPLTGERTSAPSSRSSSESADGGGTPPVVQVEEIRPEPNLNCVGHKMYGTGYGVCVDGGELED